MKVKVSSWWTGNSKYYFKLEFRTRHGSRLTEILTSDGSNWNREHASRALDLFESVWGVNRRSIAQGGMAMTDGDGEWELAPIKRGPTYSGYIVLNGRDERVNALVDKWVATDPDRLGEGLWVLSHLTPDEVTTFMAEIQELTIND